MTVLAPRKPSPGPSQVEQVQSPPPRLPGLRACIAAFLATAAAGWMTAGLFIGIAPRVVAVGGALLGAGIVLLSSRSRRAAVAQYFVLPAAALIGTLLVLPDARGGADLVSLVSESLRAGGLAQPPLPFDPGWRFVLVVLSAVLAAASASLALSVGRPKLAAALPAPLIIGAALLAPPGSEALNGGVAITLVLAALGVSFGAELTGGAAGDAGGFERKRIGRAAGLLVLLVAAMVGLSQARFLFPATTKERVVPAQRPTRQAPLPDRVLFTVTSRDPGPWRLGVLDSYDGRAWLLPSYDPGRLRAPAADGTVDDPRIRLRGDLATTETTFQIAALEGRTLPVKPGVQGLRNLGVRVEVDPATGSIRTAETRLHAGLSYTVRSVTGPTGKQLSEAPPPPAWTEAYVSAPEAPNEVVALLAKAPQNPWDRLQVVRAKLYREVIAAGAGHAAEVPPERVAELLRGTEATPYEITAAEALLARWAGVPARIGYGFYNGDRTGETASVRPRHGATWLEVYFEGYGWVPVVGVPPRARASLSDAEQNENINVRPSEELALTVHVPIRLQSVRLVYRTVRYWTFVALGWAAGLALAWWAFPGVCKVVRRGRRARWARAHGVEARIAVAYAELRDTAADLGAGAAAATPLGFRDLLAKDDEHDELAWLVTRALWGDLDRDLRDTDAVAAEEMARSVRQRLVRAHRLPARVAAFGSRTSLRAPYTTEVPNVWPSWLRERAPIRRRVRARLARRKRNRIARKALGTGLLALVMLTSCGGDGALRAGVNELPARIVPDRLEGITFRREPRAERAYRAAGTAALVQPGRVYTVRQGTTIQASVQAAAFKPGISALDEDIRRGVLRSIGTGGFNVVRLGRERVYAKDLPEQRLLLWFTPDGGAMIMLDARRGFADADRAFAGILATVQGEAPEPAGPPPVVVDPRRGAEA